MNALQGAYNNVTTRKVVTAPSIDVNVCGNFASEIYSCKCKQKAAKGIIDNRAFAFAIFHLQSWNSNKGCRH